MDLNKIVIGDIHEAPPLFAGFSPEPVLLIATKIHATKVPKVVEFKANYFGVSLGKAIATLPVKEGDAVSWEWKTK